MQQRRGTAAQWTAANPILAAGEIGFETDTNKFKMGNGSSAWGSLQYFANAAELAAIIDGAPDLLNTLNELAAAIGDDPTFYATLGEDVSNLQASVQSARDDAAGALSTHASDTTLVHGIADTSTLALQSDVQSARDDAAGALSTHASDTTLVHGIADTSLLATTANVQSAIDDAAGALSTHSADTTSVHGIADTSVLVVQSDLSAHNTETENVHGIADTSVLVTQSDLSAHNLETENVHGIADTSVLVTQSDLSNAVSEATVDQEALAGIGIDWNSVDQRFDIDATIATKQYADDAVSAHDSDSTSVHGIADTSELETQTGAQAKADLAQGAAENYTDSLVGDVTVDGTTGNTVSARIAAAEAYTDSQIDAHVAVTTNVHGIADTTKIVLKDALSTTLDGALVIEGDLTVNGTNFAASATSITIEDNMLQLAHENAANTVDLGIVVGYNDGAAKHSGIVRDVSADSWKLFKGVTTEPSTTVDFTQGSLDDLALNNITVAGVVFTDGTQSKEGVPSRTPIINKTASYTLSALTERDSMIEFSGQSGMTVTIPAESVVNYPIGTTIDVLQTASGQVTIAGAIGVTVNATPGLKLRTQWSSATLMKRASDTWVVYGDLTA